MTNIIAATVLLLACTNFVQSRNIADFSDIELPDPPVQLSNSSLKVINRSAKSKMGPEGQTILTFGASYMTPILTFHVGGQGITPHSQAQSTLSLMLDTGSDLTWSRSSLCMSGNDCSWWYNMHVVPNNYSVTDISYRQRPMMLTYADKSGSKCYHVTDDIVLAGKTLPGHQICAAYFSHSPYVTSFDGIIGLADSKDPTNFIGTFLRQYYPDDQKISFWYNPDVYPITKSQDTWTRTLPKSVSDAGEISLGKPDPTKYVGSFTWVPRTKDTVHWEVPFDGMVIRGQKVRAQLRTAYIDTGSSIAYLESSLFEEILLSIPRNKRGSYITQSNIQLPCKDIHIMPDLTFGFDEKTITLTAEKMFYPVTADTCNFIFARSNMNVFGSAALRHVYSTFDLQNGRFGFATLAKPTTMMQFPKSG